MRSLRALSHALPLFAALAAPIACTDAPTRSVPRPALHLEIIGGDGQPGEPGRPLPRSIEVRVADDRGAPVAGVLVRWQAAGGGTVSPRESRTDLAGVARAQWQLGTAPGQQNATAFIAGGETVTFSARFEGERPPPMPVPLPITLATFDGSGQAVHPDWALLPDALGVGLGAMAITPYPGGDARLELPSLFATGDLLRWRVPAGVVNPVARPQGWGHLSDPDLVWVPGAGELRLYYREVTGDNVIQLQRSTDGVRWSAPEEVARGPNHTIVSPAVVRRDDGAWRMWSVNSGAAGCGGASATVELRTSSDGRRWSPPATVPLAQEGFSPWHIEVQWIASRGEYWALYAVKTAGTCATPAIYLATSTDGVSWRTYPGPVLARGAIPELEHVVYRSTFSYDAATDQVTFIYSGARYTSGQWIWRAAVQRRDRAELFQSLQNPPRADLEEPLPDDIPPLLEAP